jgi:hypothetical protein
VAIRGRLEADLQMARHQDGGKLILDTYTEVFGASDADYEKAQLAKIK